MMKCLLVTVVLSTLVGCAEDKNDFGSEPFRHDPILEIPVEIRAEILPNDLFEAVWSNSPEQARDLIKQDPGLLDDQNQDGNTPLGLAISLGYRGPAQVLLEATTEPLIYHRNKSGESYVFLAARSGFHEMITWLGNVYGSSLGLPIFFSFARLDPDTESGERALFVAANRQVAEALESQYHRDSAGMIKFWLWDFVLRTDKAGRNFLHGAGAGGRTDLALWAGQRLCSVTEWEKDSNWLLSIPAWGWEHFWRGVEVHTDFEYWLNEPTAQLFNRQDSEGRTPLHLAIINKRWATARALASCRWLDYDLADSHGDLVLHSFFEVLDPAIPSFEQEAKDFLTFLLRQETALRRFYKSAPNRVNHVNQDGDSPMHLAARLADPFFFNLLKEYGDIYLLDKNGVSAESLFLNRQKQVGASVR